MMMNKASDMGMSPGMGLNSSMSVMGSSRNMQAYMPMNSYSHLMSPSLSNRAPGMEMADADPSRLSYPSDLSTPSAPRYMNPMPPVDVKPQRPPIVAYSSSDLSLPSDSADYCQRIPPVLAQQLMDDEWNNHCLPERFLMRRPALSVSQVKTLSTTLLMYIFYTQTRDCLQLIAAQELYARDLVYHKSKRTWYLREKNITNYASIAVKEMFSVSSWSFVPCSEMIRSTELLLPAALSEYLKMLSQLYVCFVVISLCGCSCLMVVTKLKMEYEQTQHSEIY